MYGNESRSYLSASGWLENLKGRREFAHDLALLQRVNGPSVAGRSPVDAIRQY